MRNRFWFHLHRERWRYIFGFVLLIAASTIVMVPPIVIGRAVDAIDDGTSKSELAKYAAVIIGLSLVEGTVRFTGRILVSGGSRHIEYRLRQDLAEHFMNLDQDFYITNQTGDLMARATNDMQRVRELAGPATLEISRAVMMMLIGFCFMLTVSAKLAVVSLVYFPLLTFVIVRFRHAMELRYRAVQDQFGVLSNYVQENISGIRAVKAYAQEDVQARTFADANRELMRRTMSWAYYMGSFWPLMSLGAGASLALVLWFGGRDVAAGRLTIGEFVQFTAYLAILTNPLISLGWVATMAQQGMASLRRINDVFDIAPSMLEAATPEHLAQPRGEIEFRDVRFGYNGHAVIEDVSLKIPAGKTVAIVGATGAGKTTLVNLLVRLHDPWQGGVYIDGVDIRELKLSDVRDLVGFVPQESFLFSESLLENIALGKSDATGQDVDYALETSQLINDIPQLTHGMETIVGERGATLSGGQRQRTALARALLKAPPIIVLDDALSHVDTHTEEEILKRLRSFMDQRTTILIAHRTSTLSSADFIVALEYGRIAEMGTHAELLALGGVYSRFYQRQLLAERIEEGAEG